MLALVFYIHYLTFGASETRVDKFVRLAIRPPRKLYNESFEDGVFSAPGGKKVNLKNFKVEIQDGLSLSGVLTFPIGVNFSSISSLPVVIYSHGRVGNFKEGLFVLSGYYPHMCGISYDFSGCGNGKGKYVTFGFRERQEVSAIVNYATEVLNFTKIGLYGRSMGAASSLMYAGSLNVLQTLIKGIVLDSPYSHLSPLIDYFTKSSLMNIGEVEKNAVRVEGYRLIAEKSGLEVSEINPIDSAKTCIVPVLIMHGTNDPLIPITQSEEILAAIASPDKALHRFPATHDTKRGASFQKTAQTFFNRVFGVEEGGGENKGAKKRGEKGEGREL